MPMLACTMLSPGASPTEVTSRSECSPRRSPGQHVHIWADALCTRKGVASSVSQEMMSAVPSSHGTFVVSVMANARPTKHTIHRAVGVGGDVQYLPASALVSLELSSMVPRPLTLPERGWRRRRHGASARCAPFSPRGVPSTLPHDRGPSSDGAAGKPSSICWWKLRRGRSMER